MIQGEGETAKEPTLIPEATGSPLSLAPLLTFLEDSVEEQQSPPS